MSLPSLDSLYLLAAFLAFAVGVAHSVLGERYILIRLFRRQDLPKLFGGTAFTTRTLRFAWHLTTIAWWGAAGLFWFLARGSLSPAVASGVLAAVFLCSALLTLAASRGRHLAWIVFLVIGLVALHGART